MKEQKNEEKKVAISLKDIAIKDLNDVIYNLPDLPKEIGNVIFTNADSIEVSDIARKLHKGESVEVNEAEINQIYAIVVTSKSLYKPWAQAQINQYLQDKLNIFKN